MQNNVQVNQQFTLTCAIPPSTPELPVRWLKDGVAFNPSDPSRVVVTGRSIIFSPVVAADRGRYTCMAIDNSASYTSALNVMATGRNGTLLCVF